MFYIYFICLLIFFCWFFTRNPFFIKSGLGAKLLVSLFLIRIIVAVGGFYFNLHYYPDSDSIRYQEYALEEFQVLFSDPKLYLSDLFIDGYGNNYSGLFSTKNSYWNNLGANLIIKLLSLFNLISFKSFLINTLLFNVLIFTGSIALYRVFLSVFPEGKYPLVGAIFLLPSALLFSSYTHKEGVILLLLSLTLFQLFSWFKYKSDWKRLFFVLFFLLLILSIRVFVFVAVVPALIALVITKLGKVKALPTFIIIYTALAALFFLSPFISPKINLPEIVSNRQTTFLKISDMGESTLEKRLLEPTFKGFIQNAPEALNHVLLRPYLFEGEKQVYLPFALEILLFGVLLLIFLFFRKREPSPVPPLTYFCLFFSLTILLIIGYTIPAMGAFVRYRSIYFIFLMLPVLVYTDWNRVQKRLRLPSAITNNKI